MYMKMFTIKNLKGKVRKECGVKKDCNTFFCYLIRCSSVQLQYSCTIQNQNIQHHKIVSVFIFKSPPLPQNRHLHLDQSFCKHLHYTEHTMGSSKKKVHLLISAYVIQGLENTCPGCEIEGIYFYCINIYVL